MKATIPYIKVDIPIWVVFRALGVISDRDILEHICYDMQDIQMLEMLKPCIDDGFVIQDREVSLFYLHFGLPLLALVRLLWTSLATVVRPRVSTVNTVFATHRKFCKRRCCLMSPWPRGQSPRRLSSSAT